MAVDKIMIGYQCLVCGTKAEVAVRYRERSEGLKEWMDETGQAIGDDHAKRAPRCPARNADIKIPMPVGSEGVGMRVAQ